MGKEKNELSRFFESKTRIRNIRPCTSAEDIRIMQDMNEKMAAATREYMAKVEMSHKELVGFRFSGFPDELI